MEDNKDNKFEKWLNKLQQVFQVSLSSSTLFT
jgi:hypothetical protein